MSKAFLRRRLAELTGAPRVSDEALERLESALLTVADALLETVAAAYATQRSARFVQDSKHHRDLALRLHHVEANLCSILPRLPDLLSGAPPLSTPRPTASPAQEATNENGAAQQP